MIDAHNGIRTSRGVRTEFNRAGNREPKRFISWTLYSAGWKFIKSGDYSPSNPKSVAWMSRFVMWATGDGNIIVFRKQEPKQIQAQPKQAIIENL